MTIATVWNPRRFLPPYGERFVAQSIAADVAHDLDGPVVLGRDLTEVLI